MKAQWKSVITKRINNRNINQGDIYKDILESYNTLLEENNNLLATVASLSKDTNNLLNNSFHYSSDKYSLKEPLSKNVFSKEEPNKKKESNCNTIFKFFNDSPNNFENQIKENNIFQNIVSKKEFFDILKEKEKNEELISLFKKSLNEKEKLFNIIIKENEILKKTILEKEKKLFEKKKISARLIQSVNENKLEIKMHLKNSEILKKELKSNDEEIKELTAECESLKKDNRKLIKQIVLVKNAKKIKDKECYNLTQKVIHLNIENKRLLKSLLKCNRKYRDQLVKIKNIYWGIHDKTNIISDKFHHEKKLLRKKKCVRIQQCKFKEQPIFVNFNKLHELYVLKKYFRKIKRKKISFLIHKKERKNKNKSEEKKSSLKIKKKNINESYCNDNQSEAK